ncbi:hypothetical protein RI578_06445 [Streptomyces sp. BB1-1-1]|uniref:hypothetical protein n=1 Tax=Streptomyces sp. BB1-1-1 TaxID=3074430 RepID=UPI0028773FA1|nr:hypothetical protein [Streptomyces sp. BB1-1-1]WND33952.1 hypothetical protein RI578_06445 [Streptomyces sp. BB1-1-1]
MSDYVRLRHPSLPKDQTITVAASAVPHHRAAGWVPVNEPEPQPAAPAPAAPADPDPKPARTRRRATEGE